MTAEQLKDVVRTYRYRDATHVIVDSLPQPYRDDFARFLHGSACPLGDGKNRYAYMRDFERYIANLTNQP